MTDYAQTLRRESPGKSLSTKVIEGLNTERPTIFGQVAEFAEARERSMVLTRNKQSRTFDLTEPRQRPRNFQLKFYGNGVAAVRAILAEFKDVPRQARRGITAQVALDQAEAVGLLGKRIFRGTTLYSANDGTQTRLFASVAFDTAQDARKYSAVGKAALEELIVEPHRSAARTRARSAGIAQTGVAVWLLADSAPAVYEDVIGLRDPAARSEEAYLRLGRHSTEVVAAGALIIEGGIATASNLSRAVAQSSRLMAVSRWAGPLGWMALAGMEGFEVWQWNAGYKTDRRFYTGQAQILGGLAGGVVFGWVGAKSGSLVGGTIGAFFGPEGIPIGAGIGFVVGGITVGAAGGYVSSWAAASATNTYFEFKDQQQEAEFVRFVCSHYGVP
jgi:hypothetical protein